MKKLILFFSISFLSLNTFAEKANVDSLWAVWKDESKADTTRANAFIPIIEAYYPAKIDSVYYYAKQLYEFAKSKKLNKAMGDGLQLMGVAHKYKGEHDTALVYIEQALQLFRDAGDKKLSAGCLNDMGVIYQRLGKYEEALDKHREALPLTVESGDQRGTGNTYNYIGVIYRYLGNYPLALDNFLKSLKIMEDIGNKRGELICYNNIGVVYEFQKNYAKALEMYEEAFRLYSELGYKGGIAMARGNMGNVYTRLKNYDLALENYLIALDIFIEIKKNGAVANTHLNLAAVYAKQEKYTEALESARKSLELFEKQGNQWGIAASQISIGEIHNLLRQPAEAKKWLLQGLQLSTAIAAKDVTETAYRNLAQADSTMGNYKDAFAHHKMYVLYRDSSLNEENTKKSTQLEMQYEFDKKEAAILAEQEKKDALADAELRRKKLQRNASLGGLVLMLLLAGVFFVQRNRISKEKKRSDELLLNILPADVADELKQKGYSDARQFDEVTVLFTDFKDFTAMSEKLSPTALVSEINDCFKAFDQIMEKYGIEKIKTIGDAYMAAGGLPVPKKTNAQDVVNAALEIRDWVLQHMKNNNGEGFEVRIGVHTGPVVAGIVGIKKFQYDIWGDTVNTASRMESNGEVGKVNISQTTYELTKDQFNCEPRGKIAAKGKGEIEMYFVEHKA